MHLHMVCSVAVVAVGSLQDIRVLGFAHPSNISRQQVSSSSTKLIFSTYGGMVITEQWVTAHLLCIYIALKSCAANPAHQCANSYIRGHDKRCELN